MAHHEELSTYFPQVYLLVRGLISDPLVAQEVVTETLLKFVDDSTPPTLNQVLKQAVDLAVELHGLDLKSDLAQWTESAVPESIPELSSAAAHVPTEESDKVMEGWPTYSPLPRGVVILKQWLQIGNDEVANILGLTSLEVEVIFWSFVSKISEGMSGDKLRNALGALAKFSKSPDFIPSLKFKQSTVELLHTQNPTTEKAAKAAAPLPPGATWQDKLKKKWLIFTQKPYFNAVLAGAILLLILIIGFIAAQTLFGNKGNSVITDNTGVITDNDSVDFSSIDTTRWLAYESKVLGVNFQYPPEWQVDESPDFSSSFSEDPNIKPIAVPGISLQAKLNFVIAEPTLSFLTSEYRLSNSSPLNFNALVINDQRFPIKTYSSSQSTDILDSNGKKMCSNKVERYMNYLEIGGGRYVYFPYFVQENCDKSGAVTVQKTDPLDIEKIRRVLLTLKITTAASFTEGWTSRPNTDWGVEMFLPPTWQGSSLTDFSGTDGYAKLSLTDNFKDTLANTCSQITYPGMGTGKPLVRMFTNYCLIYPTSNQPAAENDKGLIIVRLLNSAYVNGFDYNYAQIAADKDFIKEIGASLKLTTPKLGNPYIGWKTETNDSLSIQYPPEWTAVSQNRPSGLQKGVTISNGSTITITIGLEDDYPFGFAQSRTYQRSTVLKIGKESVTSNITYVASCTPGDDEKDCVQVANIPDNEVNVILGDFVTTTQTATVGGTSHIYHFTITIDKDNKPSTNVVNEYTNNLATIKNILASFQDK